MHRNFLLESRHGFGLLIWAHGCWVAAGMVDAVSGPRAKLLQVDRCRVYGAAVGWIELFESVQVRSKSDRSFLLRMISAIFQHLFSLLYTSSLTPFLVLFPPLPLSWLLC